MHVNKRVKSLSRVKLPVADLIQQYKDPDVSQFVTVSRLFLYTCTPKLDGLHNNSVENSWPKYFIGY